MFSSTRCGWLLVLVALGAGCHRETSHPNGASPIVVPIAATGPSAVPTGEGANLAPKMKDTMPQAKTGPGQAFVAIAGDVGLRAPAAPTGDPTKDVCELVDVRSGAILDRIDASNTAAGGSTVVCTGLAARGNVVLFTNSRGVYAKEARTHAALGCGDGVFADDVKSCIQLDASPMAYGGTEKGAEAVDFPIQLCERQGNPCKTLVTVPRGLNRAVGAASRTWDAAYCSNTRVAVVASGKLQTFDVGTGRKLETFAAPRGTRVSCRADRAEVRDAGGATRAFVLH